MTNPEILDFMASRLDAPVAAEMPIHDLPCDSLEYLDLIVALEDASGVDMEEGKQAEFSTVGELAEYFTC